MKIISDLNDYLKTVGKPYVFTVPIFISHLEDGVAHVQMSLRVTDIKDNSYYDMVVIRTIFDDGIVDIIKCYDTFEYHVNREVIFSKPTSTLLTLDGTVVKTFRDILNIILNDQILPTR